MPENSGPLSVTVTREGGVAHVRLEGELDIATAPFLRAELAGLLAEQPTELVADLHELDFVDLAGLKVLLEASRALAPIDARVLLRSPSTTLRRVVEVLGLGDRLHLDPPS